MVSAAARPGDEALRRDELLAYLNRAVELNPGDAEAIASRGQVYAAMGRYDEALADYKRAIELDPATPGPSTAAATATER